ncbi:MAG TPA: DEAD/DEAH box helicase [Polyangiaceae bacterium]|jgi:ATP-dependent RNA helicase RhlE|nr:DEAD/DEAH box helicase [Polyangiaceae bacterium]
MTPEQEQAVAASPFTALGLPPAIVRAVVEEEYTIPSPVQREVIPSALQGRDVLAGAQTGTGKTAAFVLPILAHLAAPSAPQTTSVAPAAGQPEARPERRAIRALILTPTRELAAQIADRVAAYGRHLRIRHAVIYGGVSQQRQEIALRGYPDLVVATPGRLLDLMQQGFVRLEGVTHFVLDEADRMLDMGFVHDVRRVVSALPSKRQTLFFSATIAPVIETLARTMLADPARVAIAPKVTTAESVDQTVVFVEKADKRAMLERILADARAAGPAGAVTRTLVFTRTKHGANRLSEQLERAGIGTAAIHGNKSQGARERALEGFRRGTTPVLVATDVAARGIDIDGITLVVNYDLPNVPESYVHRIGRTGRAGATGKAISFCDREERAFLMDIERLIRRRLPVTGDDPRPASTALPGQASSPQRRVSGQGHPQGQGQPHGHARTENHGQNRHAPAQPRPQAPVQARPTEQARRGPSPSGGANRP